MKRSDIDKLEIIIGQLKSIHLEISVLAKKSPNDAVNKFKIKFINATIKKCNDFLGDRYKPQEDFDSFDTDDVPSNSDVTFIVSLYAEAIEKFRADNIKCDMGRWYFIVDDSEDMIKTAPPLKLK